MGHGDEDTYDYMRDVSHHLNSTIFWYSFYLPRTYYPYSWDVPLLSIASTLLGTPDPGRSQRHQPTISVNSRFLLC